MGFREEGPQAFISSTQAIDVGFPVGGRMPLRPP